VAREIVIWWLTAQAFGLAGLPLTRFLFRALPDRGYAFAKTLGLLLAGYLAWLLAMLGLAPFGRALVVLCAVAVGALGFMLTKDRRPTTDDRRPTADGGRTTEDNRPTADDRRPTADEGRTTEGEAARSEERGKTIIGWIARFKLQLPTPNPQLPIPANWRLILAYEAIFLLALVFVALLRSYNPDPWNTERPMDYALFNAIRNSPSFPPHDPWLAGYSINYYYFGYLLMAAVSLVSGIGWAAGYNLSLALVFALAALGVAGIIWNLIALTTRDQGRKTNDQGTAVEARFGPWSLVFGRIAVALLAIVLVLFAANQGGALQIITGTNMAVALDGRDLARAITNGVGPREPLALGQPFHGDYFDGTTAITPTNTLEGFNFVFHSWWWNPTRAVWDDYTARGDPAKHYAITEFPFFSFLLGDMHPHVMALPFGLLALALALQTLARPAAPAFAMGRRGWIELALVGIVLGGLYFLNSWDLPTYVLLFLGALLLLYVRLEQSQRLEIGDWRSGSRETISNLQSLISGVWWRHYATQAAMALLAAWMLYAPFHLTFKSLVGGRGLPIGLVTWAKTPLHSVIIIFGLFLLPLVTYVFVQGRGSEGARGRWGEGATAGIAHSSSRPLDLRGSLGWVTVGAFAIGALIGFPLAALLPLAIYAITLAIGAAGRPATAFALWAIAVGCLICFGTEIVYIRDVFESRLNTIFKFYYQAWLIWGVLAGYAVWWLFAGPTRDQGPKTKDQRSTVDDQAVEKARKTNLVLRPWSLVLVAALFSTLLAGALVYPFVVVRYALSGESQRVGLDGLTPRERSPEGAASIAWLRANAPAGSVVLEAVGGSYNGDGFGGVSAATGLPTVLGWPGHEQQWRGGDPAVLGQLGPREADVTTIYSSTDTTQASELLRKYNVEYIYVGPLERATYAPQGIAKLAQLGDVVFQQGDVVIYRVR
jgi:YYY domain-containing protein